jgi:hypothetical protein
MGASAVRSVWRTSTYRRGRPFALASRICRIRQRSPCCDAPSGCRSGRRGHAMLSSWQSAYGLTAPPPRPVKPQRRPPGRCLQALLGADVSAVPALRGRTVSGTLPIGDYRSRIVRLATTQHTPLRLRDLETDLSQCLRFGFVNTRWTRTRVSASGSDSLRITLCPNTEPGHCPSYHTPERQEAPPVGRGLVRTLRAGR